jgi:hypothetical protein
MALRPTPNQGFPYTLRSALRFSTAAVRRAAGIPARWQTRVTMSAEPAAKMPKTTSSVGTARHIDLPGDENDRIVRQF